jgi:hypothetical protein
MGKTRFGNWNKNDSNVKYDNMSVTDPKYRETKGRGFGAQTIDYIENDKLQNAIIAYDENSGNGIDLTDINDLRHTFFHEWTHVMELDKLVGEKEDFVTIGDRTFRNNEKKENGEAWGTGLSTREYGENAEKYAHNKDEQGRKRIMHNQITEGMVELIARKVMEQTMGKDAADKVIHKERYFTHTRIAQSIMNAFGEEDTIATFVSNSQQLVNRLENINIEGRDALHYMSDFINDQNYDQLIPQYANRTAWFNDNIKQLIALFKVPEKNLGSLQNEVGMSEMNGDSVDRLEEIFSKYGVAISGQDDEEKFKNYKTSYSNLISSEENFFDGLSDLLVLSEQEHGRNTTLQEIGKETTKSFSKNPSIAMEAINSLENGIKTKEETKKEQEEQK